MKTTHPRMMAWVIRRLVIGRQKLHLSQAQAARLIGIHRPTLTMIEGQRQRLTVDLMLTMCEVYGLIPASLFAYSDPDERFDQR